MRIVVTGGAGFIGSHLCERLLADGHQVVVVDNLVTGSVENIAEFAGQEGFEFIKHDVSDFILVAGDVDAVMHLASPASPNPASPYGYPQLPIQTLKVGALGTHNALGLARANRARFLLASTSEVYGDPQEHPQKETYVGYVDPIGPRSVYDEAKRFAEAITMAYHRYHGLDTRIVITMAYHRYHGLDTRIVRIFNTYGPKMRLDDGRAVPNFLTQALTGKPLTVYGDGSQTRSFCYIDDMLQGIVRLLQSDFHQPVNIGNPAEISILQLAETVNEVAKSSAGIEFMPDERAPADPQRRQPDIQRAWEQIEWRPETELKHGLSATIEEFRDRV